MFTHNSLLKYPISVKNIPDQGSAYRVKTGSRLSIPLATPSSDVETFIIFTDDFARAEEIHAARQSCKRGDTEACEADLKIYGNINKTCPLNNEKNQSYQMNNSLFYVKHT